MRVVSGFFGHTAATRVVVLAAVVAGACGARAPRMPSGAAAPGNELTLYRDRALIKQRIEVVVPEAARAQVTFTLPAGVGIDDVAVLDRGVLTVSSLQGPSAMATDPTPELDPEAEEELEELDPCAELEEEPPATLVVEALAAEPTTITFEVAAPRAGRYGLSIGYVTDRVAWDAAYTMTTTPARTTASLRGAIAIRNQLGVPLATTHIYVVDTELTAWRGQMAEQLGSALTGAATIPQPRYVGELALATGETRVELLPSDPPRAMRSVLVFDPIGTKLDHIGSRPILDAGLGAEPVPPRVTESFEIVRARPSSEGLPGGPVRLLERRRDGSLAVLGESRLFDAATRVAAVDTVAIGTAEGVTGARTRRDFTVDEDHHRVVEEFLLTIHNTRAHPVEVVLREHLYRGQNWTLAYQTAREPTKEGPQQISLRVTAPPGRETKVMYVVVYTGL